MENNTIPSVFDELDEGHAVFATVGQRFINFIIDSVVYIVFVTTGWMVFAYFFGRVFDAALSMSYNEQALLIFVMGLVPYVLLYTLIEGASKGRSLGKLVTRTKVVKRDLSAITWGDAFLRTLGRLIPFEGFSIFDGPAWHDSIAHTYVIKKRQTRY